MTYTPPGVESRRAGTPAPAPKTSGHAIAGLIVGLAGLCTCGVGGIAGLVLSIVALKKIDASRGTLGGRGLAIAGIIASAVCILVGLVIGLIVLGFFLFAAARSESHHARPERDWGADHNWSTPAPSPGALLPPGVPLVVRHN
jgi:MFS family permease